MRGGDIAGLLIRQARLQRDWSQEGLCRGICAPSYLSKIEQGKAAPSPEVTELLLHRLGLVWTPEPEGLAPCWKALLSGSPNFDSLYEQLVQPRREILASSPLAADALLLDAFYADEMRPLPVEWEPFLSTRQLALQRGLQGRWEEAVRLEPLPLLAAHYGEFLYAEGEYTAAIEVLRDAYRSASDAGYPYLMLSCRAWMGNCYSDLGRMEEMLTHYSVAERLAEALRDTGSLSALRYNVASTQLELGQPEKALPYFASLPRPGFLDLHKLAICHEQLGHREQALTAVQQAEPRPPAKWSSGCWRWCAIGWSTRTTSTTIPTAPNFWIASSVCETHILWASPASTCRGCWRGTRPTVSTVKPAACWRSFL